MAVVLLEAAMSVASARTTTCTCAAAAPAVLRASARSGSVAPVPAAVVRPLTNRRRFGRQQQQVVAVAEAQRSMDQLYHSSKLKYK